MMFSKYESVIFYGDVAAINAL